MNNAAANATLILQPPDSADVGPSIIDGVNCKPNKIIEARLSAESDPKICNRLLISSSRFKSALKDSSEAADLSFSNFSLTQLYYSFLT